MRLIKKLYIKWLFYRANVNRNKAVKYTRKSKAIYITAYQLNNNHKEKK
jgi:hypothetical protein